MNVKLSGTRSAPAFLFINGVQFAPCMNQEMVFVFGAGSFVWLFLFAD